MSESFKQKVQIPRNVSNERLGAAFREEFNHLGDARINVGASTLRFTTAVIATALAEADNTAGRPMPDHRHVIVFVKGYLRDLSEATHVPEYSQEPYVSDTIEKTFHYLRTGNTAGDWSDPQCNCALLADSALRRV